MTWSDLCFRTISLTAMKFSGRSGVGAVSLRGTGEGGAIFQMERRWVDLSEPQFHYL